MRLLIRLLVLVVLVGVVVQQGGLDILQSQLPGLADRLGVPAEQVPDTGTLQRSLSPGSIMEWLGTLPPPWGGLAQVLVGLLAIGFLCSLAVAVAAGLMRFFRWLGDMIA